MIFFAYAFLFIFCFGSAILLYVDSNNRSIGLVMVFGATFSAIFLKVLSIIFGFNI